MLLRHRHRHRRSRVVVGLREKGTDQEERARREVERGFYKAVGPGIRTRGGAAIWLTARGQIRSNASPKPIRRLLLDFRKRDPL